MFALILGIVIILVLGGVAIWFWNQNNMLKEEFEKEQKKIKVVQMQLAKEYNELQQAKKDAQLECEQLLNKTKSQAEKFLSKAKLQVEQYRQEVDRLRQVEAAYKNQIDDYQVQAMMPTIQPIDELASEAGHQAIGQQLKDARKTFRSLLKNDKAASGGSAEQRLMLVDMFNHKVDTVQSEIKGGNFNVLNQKINDAYAVVNHYAKSNGWSAVISQEYLRVRLTELRWATAIYELRQKEREEQRELREQMREEERSRKEIEKALKDAEKEERMLQAAIAKMQQQWETASQEQKALFEQQKQELEQKLHEAESRNQRALSMAQQTKAGHVYVISNIGSFGNDVVKIGMTRRLEPMDRVKELGSASVPFLFDVHALIYSENAPELERQLHQEFNDYRVNKINERKEFFKVSLADVKQKLLDLNIEVKFTLAAEAEEYRRTLQIEALSPEEQSHILDDLMKKEEENDLELEEA